MADFGHVRHDVGDGHEFLGGVTSGDDDVDPGRAQAYGIHDLVYPHPAEHQWVGEFVQDDEAIQAGLEGLRGLSPGRESHDLRPTQIG